MSPAIEHSQDAITKSEMSGATVPSTDIGNSVPKTNNAFTALMSPKKPNAPPKVARESPATTAISFLGRDGLGTYIASPESFPASRVISHSEKFVTIHDLYPKSSVHLLLLPRDPEKTLMHPFEAFQDQAFLDEVLEEVMKLRILIAKELRRRYGKFSIKEQAREQAMDADPTLSEELLPPGRDWDKEVISGVHAHPSMNHLHVHILSVDRESDSMRRRKHYNSFATPFMVPVEDFPLAEDDKRRYPGREGYLGSDLKCWRCGKNYGSKFARLKDHLAEEFGLWKRE